MLAALLLAAALHAAPERPVQPPPRDAQPYEQVFRGVAGGEGIALALWDEVHELRAARVDRDGKTLDATPLAIARDVWGAATVSRGVDGWLVVWSHAGSIAARTVGDDGSLGAPVTIATRESTPALSVAFDGASHLVVWKESTKLTGARLSAAGQVLESPFLITETGERHVGALLPRPGGGFALVLWLQAIDVVQLDAGGRVDSSRRVARPADLRHTVAGFDAAGRLVLMWLDGLDVFLQRGDGSPELLERGTSSMSHVPRSVVVAGGATYALFQREGDVVLKTLDGGADRVWDVAYLTMNSAAVSLGDRVLVAATVMPPSAGSPYEVRNDLYVSVVDAALAEVEPARLLYVEPRLQFHPAIAGNVVVWMESVDEERRKQIVAKVGGRAPLVVAEDASPIMKPRVATSGDGFVVLWLGHDLRPWSRHVRGDGTPGETVRLADLPLAIGGQCLTWTGTEYVAAFAVRLASDGWVMVSEVWAQPLTRDGAIAGPAVRLTERGAHLEVACASSETATLFAWERAGSVEGALRTHGGTVVAPLGIGFGKNVSVASNGTNFLVAWAGARAVVSANGTPDRPIPTPGDAATVGARRGEYVVLTESAGILSATPLDASGQATGEPVVLAHDATRPELSGATIVYQRDTASLFMPRWQVFTRDLWTPTRRRTVR